MRKERLLKFNQARQINSQPAAHTTFCEREERHIWHWSFLSLPGWLGPSAFVQAPDVDETVLLPEKQNKNKDKDLSKWSLTIHNNNKDGSFFHLTRDVMCPCGTSSGSSSLQTIQGSFMLETMGFLLLKHDMAANKSYLHLCQHVSHNFAIFIFCNVWELCRRGEKGVFSFQSTTYLAEPQQHVSPRYAATHLRPRQPVVEVVFHLIVFRKAQQVTMLHVHEVLRLKGGIQKVRLMYRRTLSDHTLKGT